MSRKFQFSFVQLAQAYQASRQHMHNLESAYGYDTLLDPGRLFIKLCDAKRSALRTKLSDPAGRAEVLRRLSALRKIDELKADITSIAAAIEKLTAKPRAEIVARHAEIAALRKSLPLPRP